MDVFAALLHETLLVSACLSLPILAVGMLVGIIIAVFQAATSLQDQSIGVFPKICIVGAVIACTAPLGFSEVSALFHRAITSIPLIVAGGAS